MHMGDAQGKDNKNLLVHQDHILEETSLFSQEAQNTAVSVMPCQKKAQT